MYIPDLAMMTHLPVPSCDMRLLRSGLEPLDISCTCISTHTPGQSAAITPGLSREKREATGTQLKAATL